MLMAIAISIFFAISRFDHFFSRIENRSRNYRRYFVLLKRRTDIYL